MKKIIISLIFIVITILLFNKYDRILTAKIQNNNIYSYYDEKNPIDVLFVGNSRILTISPIEIWNKYGIVSYNRGGSGQYFKQSYYLSKEFIKRNKAKLIIINVSFFETMYKHEPAIQHTKNMKFSSIKVEAYLDIYKDKINNYLNIYTNIDEFHTRWKDIKKNDFIQYDYTKGYFIHNMLFKISPQNQIINSDRHIQFDVLQEEPINYIKELMDYAKKHKTKILLIKMPSSLSKESIKLDEQWEEVCKINGWDFINYNKLLKDINFDFNKDMFDWSHLNIYGARKVINHLVPYIIKNYNIPNRKNDSKYASWNIAYNNYIRAINREEIRQLEYFSAWINQAFFDGYIVIVASNGNILNKLPETIKENLQSIGLKKYDTEKEKMNYVAIMDANNIFFEEISNNPVTYKGRMKNIVNLFVSSDGNATINVSGKSRSKNMYGLNFVIYDKVNREIVDSIWLDPANFNQVRR